MCGIAGFWQRGGGAGDIESLWSMLRTIEYRGPDDSGVWNDGNVFLGHCRLSILDLTARGRQPMSNDLGDIWISYNGEIYNFKEIRRQLIGEGVRFRSNTDTEVVVKAYERWGIDCLHRFRGMFAFAIWDRRENKLFLVRDRAGVKPLFYAEQGQTVIFGSEVRAIRAYPKMSRDISLDSLFHYLQFGYISPPESIFSDIQAVRPGHVVQFRLKGSPTEQQYWDIETSYRLGLEEQKRGVWDRKSEAEVEEELEELLAQAFRYRMVSDVPVGLFLSGGIDSTIVAAILSKRLGVDLRTFTVGFNEEEFNEANTAKRIAEALGTNHRELYVGSESLLTGINRMPEIYDEPFGDSSGVPTNLLCTFAREDVKVALSADGGDELFCGYSRYTVADRYRRLQRWAPALVSHLASHILDGLPNGLLHGLYAAISLGRR
ncbi:MAG: asparagine synthase (glutamine-hydrolyzing), partial [Gammaproteobacteria bacterium]|nr:asparagine synthase (glutamine-hydrolyzing) [Gammaproteobacteria bacterium]